MSIKIENDLAQTKQMIIDMIIITENQYHDMVKCLETNDIDLCQIIISSDETINKMQEVFIEVSLWKIAKQQMVAKDLRRIVGFILIVKEVERIADYAKSICRYYIKYKPSTKLISFLKKLVAKVIEMLTEVSNIFKEEKIKLAYNILKYDTELDKIYKIENDNLIEKIREASLREEIKIITLTMQQLHSIESAGTHIINIAEILIYIIEGKIYDFELPI